MRDPFEKVSNFHFSRVDYEDDGELTVESDIILRSLVVDFDHADSNIPIDENKIPLCFKEEFEEIFVRPSVVPGLPEH